MIRLPDFSSLGPPSSQFFRNDVTSNTTVESQKVDLCDFIDCLKSGLLILTKSILVIFLSTEIFSIRMFIQPHLYLSKWCHVFPD